MEDEANVVTNESFVGNEQYQQLMEKQQEEVMAQQQKSYTSANSKNQIINFMKSQSPQNTQSLNQQHQNVVAVKTKSKRIATGATSTSATRMRNTKVIDLTQCSQTTGFKQMIRSPTQSTMSLARIQTNLSSTQRMKLDQRREGEEIEVEGSLQLSGTQLLGQSSNYTNEIKSQLLGFTQRIMQGLTSPQNDNAQKQVFGMTHSGGRNNFRGQNLVQTTPCAFPQTLETQPSRITRHGSPLGMHHLQNPKIISGAAPAMTQRPPRPASKLNLTQNIQRIIQNNISEQGTNRSSVKPLDTKRTIQLQQQPTERLRFDPSAREKVGAPIGDDDSTKYKILSADKHDNSSSQIKQTLILLQQSSPFKNMMRANQQQKSENEGLGTLKPRHLFNEGEDIEASDKSENELEDLDIAVKEKTPSKPVQKLGLAGATAQQESRVIPPESKGSTERHTMTAFMQGNTSEQSKRKIQKQEPTPKKVEPTLDERHRYFRLMSSQHKTLGEQITKNIGAKQSQMRRHLKNQPSIAESSHQSSSFDSINPNDLVLRTQTGNSNYTSVVSGATPAAALNQFGAKLGSLYMQTRSSAGLSSVYQLTNEGGETERGDNVQSATGGAAGVDKILKQIDENINTFTTNEFEQLRDKIKKVGFNNAQVLVQNKIGQKNGNNRVIKELSLSFVSEDNDEQESAVKSETNKQDEYGFLNRKLVIASDGLESSILCTGFLSTPSILFDPYSSNPKHIATVMDHRQDPPVMAQYLPQKLLSIPTLLRLKKSCLILSCGFEHCVCLIDGNVWTWGFGGSGCLGHGKYETLTEPKQVEGIKGRTVFIEAGGYHNGIITEFGEVFTWGRCDVGQLALDQSLLQKDQMGFVSLRPQKVEQLPIAAAQIALGDAHTLILTVTGEVYAAGWHDLGQLGVPSQQYMADKKAGKVLHRVKLISEKVKQISCGAVFSVALTSSGEVYAWGSNNNGQIGIGESPDSEGSIDSEGTQKQMMLPTLVDIGVEDPQKKFTQILAGDCHVLIKDETCIRAWGQGNIIEKMSQGEENKLQDVICNQPLTLDNEIQNKMIYELGIHSSRSKKPALRVENGAETSFSEHSLGTNLRSENSSRYEILTPLQPLAATPQRKNDVPANVPRLALHDLPKMDSMSPQKQSFGSLETIKNTDDYNNFIQQKEDNEPNKFSILKSSYDDTTYGAKEAAGTTGRDKKDYNNSAGGYSDLMPITEEAKSQANEMLELVYSETTGTHAQKLLSGLVSQSNSQVVTPAMLSKPQSKVKSGNKTSELVKNRKQNESARMVTITNNSNSKKNNSSSSKLKSQTGSSGKKAIIKTAGSAKKGQKQTISVARIIPFEEAKDDVEHSMISGSQSLGGLNVEQNQGATGSDVRVTYQKIKNNASGGGTGETGRSMQQTPGGQLSLRNIAHKFEEKKRVSPSKVIDLSERSSKHQLVRKGSLGIIIDDFSNLPVCISSRPGSSGRSRSPRSPPRDRHSKSNEKQQKKSPKLLKSISSKNLIDFDHQDARFNQTEIFSNQLSVRRSVNLDNERISGSNNFESQQSSQTIVSGFNSSVEASRGGERPTTQPQLKKKVEAVLTKEAINQA